VRLQLRKRTLIVGAHEAAVSDNIDRKNGWDPPRHAPRGPSVAVERSLHIFAHQGHE